MNDYGPSNHEVIYIKGDSLHNEINEYELSNHEVIYIKGEDDDSTLLLSSKSPMKTENFIHVESEDEDISKKQKTICGGYRAIKSNKNGKNSVLQQPKKKYSGSMSTQWSKEVCKKYGLKLDVKY